MCNSASFPIHSLGFELKAITASNSYGPSYLITVEVKELIVFALKNVTMLKTMVIQLQPQNRASIMLSLTSSSQIGSGGSLKVGQK